MSAAAWHHQDASCGSCVDLLDSQLEVRGPSATDDFGQTALQWLLTELVIGHVRRERRRHPLPLAIG